MSRTALLTVAVAALGACAARAPVLVDPFSRELRAPLAVYSIDYWHAMVETSTTMEFVPREFATPAVDPTSGRMVVGTRDGVLRSVTIEGSVRWAHLDPRALLRRRPDPRRDRLLARRRRRAPRAQGGHRRRPLDLRLRRGAGHRAGARRGPGAGRLPVRHPVRGGRRRREMDLAVPAHASGGLHPPRSEHPGGARRRSSTWASPTGTPPRWTPRPAAPSGTGSSPPAPSSST